MEEEKPSCAIAVAFVIIILMIITCLGLKNLKSSMLLPLDFLKTARMNPEFERDIEDSMLASYANLPKLPGKTLFIVDVSGSMSAPII